MNLVSMDKAIALNIMLAMLGLIILLHFDKES